MRDIVEFANEIKEYLSTYEKVKQCCLYGSIDKGNYDQYSDIDIQVDVSGCDNSTFLKQIPQILARKYNIVFCDYAPSLMPREYVVSVAIDEENPFGFIDIKCIATPHMGTLQREDFSNDRVEHILKLWVINLKHWLRGDDCRQDILKMANKVLQIDCTKYSEKRLLEETLMWIENNMEEKHSKYVASCRRYMNVP